MTSKVQRGAPLQKGEREALANYVPCTASCVHATNWAQSGRTDAGVAGLPILPGTAALVVRLLGEVSP